MPPFKILPLGNFYILRDDLLSGGTKRRALGRLLPTIPQTDFTYAGTIFGHGALALALACADHGKTAHLFLSCNDADDAMLARLRDAGAQIHCASPVPIAELNLEAATWAARNNAHHFPPAFDCPAFHDAMVECLQSSLDVTAYPEIWCVSVSGTFTRALQFAFPDTALKTVTVVAGGNADFQASEKYHRPALSPPPYPACPYTDAKLWRFAEEHAAPGALVWNIAG